MDVEHLVEHSRNMKAYSIHAIKLGSGFHFLFRQPFLVGECKFKFVTIESRMFGTLDREYFFHFDLTDPGQVVDHLLVFVANLFLIGQMLPFTATAYAEMFTERLCTLGRIFMEKYSFTFQQNRPAMAMTTLAGPAWQRLEKWYIKVSLKIMAMAETTFPL